jgi:hypothetical protein
VAQYFLGLVGKPPAPASAPSLLEMNEQEVTDCYQTLVGYLNLNPGNPQNSSRFGQLPLKEILILLKDVCEEAERRVLDNGRSSRTNPKGICPIHTKS